MRKQRGNLGATGRAPTVPSPRRPITLGRRERTHDMGQALDQPSRTPFRLPVRGGPALEYRRTRCNWPASGQPPRCAHLSGLAPLRCAALGWGSRLARGRRKCGGFITRSELAWRLGWPPRCARSTALRCAHRSPKSGLLHCVSQRGWGSRLAGGRRKCGGLITLSEFAWRQWLLGSTGAACGFLGE